MQENVDQNHSEYRHFHAVITLEAGSIAISDAQLAPRMNIIDAHCNIFGVLLVIEQEKLNCTKNGHVKVL